VAANFVEDDFLVVYPAPFQNPQALPRGLTALCFFSRELIPHRFGAGSILREKKVLDLSVFASLTTMTIYCSGF